MADDLDGLLRLAVGTARAAGDVLSDYARRLTGSDDLAVTTKSSGTDPVSAADRASEELIVSRLHAARPDDAVVGEETGTHAGGSGVTWVVDPLDGTVNFLYGIPQWCVSIAAEDAGGGLVGVVHDPSRGETYAAARGGGAWLLSGDTRFPLAVSRPTGLATTLVATGFAYEPAVRADQGHEAAALLTEVRDLRRAGAAALDLAWVAAGRYDAYLEFGLQPWDWAAGRLLVEEAGGRTSLHVRALGGGDQPGLVAASPAIHDELAAWLRRGARGSGQ